MIIYFSGTGNSKYAALEIAAELHDKAVSIENCGCDIELKKDECFGVVFPTYFWEVPAVMRGFLERVKIKADGDFYSFAVITCGTTPGCSGADAGKLLKARGVDLGAAFSIRMPDSWTPVFDLSKPEKVKKKCDNADKALAAVIKQIKARKTGNRTKLKAPYFVKNMNDKMYKKARKTSNFTLEDPCIGCGSCVKQCPVKAIEMQNGKPVWTKEQCTLCLRCLHLCPKFAIQYGNGKTKQHGQYHHPKVKI